MVAVTKVLENLAKVLKDMDPPEAFELASLEVKDVGHLGARVRIVMHDPEDRSPTGEVIGMWHIYEKEKNPNKKERKPGFLKESKEND